MSLIRDFTRRGIVLAVGESNYKPKVLLIQDISEQLRPIETSLEMDFSIDVAGTESQALAFAKINDYDLILFDTGLSHVNTHELCLMFRSINSNKETPIIFLSSKDDLAKGANVSLLGVRDYILKPFHLSDLKARMQRNIQQYQLLKKRGAILRRAQLEIDIGDLKAYRVQEGDRKEKLTLTTKELRLLHRLCQNIDRVISRQSLLDTIWGKETSVTSRTVDTHVCQLRKKISGTGVLIESVYGCGYRTRLDI